MINVHMDTSLGLCEQILPMELVVLALFPLIVSNLAKPHVDVNCVSTIPMTYLLTI